MLPLGQEICAVIASVPYAIAVACCCWEDVAGCGAEIASPSLRSPRRRRSRCRPVRQVLTELMLTLSPGTSIFAARLDAVAPWICCTVLELPRVMQSEPNV